MRSLCVKHPARRPARAAAVLLLALAAIGSITAEAPAQAPPGGGLPSIDQQVVNPSPEFLVHVRVDKKYRIYAEGDTLTLKVRCEQDAYLYILYQQADGKIFQIFPNKGQPDNKIKAMQEVQVPEADDGFRWVVRAPLGEEVVKVIASKKPIDALSLPGLTEGRFTAISKPQFDAAGQQVGKEPTNIWSEHDLKIRTVKRGEPTVPPEASRRVGLFFGVSDYEFNNDIMQVQREEMMKQTGKVIEKDVKPFSLKCPINDARDMAEKLKEVGQLSEARVIVNSEATLEKMREMITEWLPSATKPGDTVFIFFSGHGGPIPDDDGDEKDKTDEMLAPYDFMDPDVLMLLNKRAEGGQLEPGLVQRVRGFYQLMADTYIRVLAQLGGKSVPGAEDKASDKAVAKCFQQSCVTDDEMGHWVQKLDGRRVVVILDACRSGGMNKTDGPPDKGLNGRPRPRKGFDFLSGEFSRLKDLDQPNLTVLAAAAETQNSVEFKIDNNGLFTKSILELLARAKGPVDARLAIETATADIDARFKERDRNIDRQILDHPEDREELEKKKGGSFTPTLFTTDPKPVYLKLPAGTN
jgi:Domain of unknown function (DUF4384)/Caspase domain